MPLVIVAIGVVLLLLLMIRFKMNGFIALVLVALAVGLMQGMPLVKVISSIKAGVGGTLGSLALIMGFGAMLGKMLADCGGAQVFVGVDVEGGKLLGFLLKLRQHLGQLLVRDLAHVGHRRAEDLHFSLGEVFKHLRRAIFANGHQQDDALIGACKRITHVRYPSNRG